MSSLLPTPEPADPVEGQPGHFEHTNWVKRALKALDQGLLRKPAGSVPPGKVLATTGMDTWSAVDPGAIGGVPTGVIVMWSGTVAPSGWALCDGTSGRPDLRNKFVLGLSPGRAVGTQGGAETVTLEASQSGVPSHPHTGQSADAWHAHELAQRHLLHRHGGLVENSGAHNHSLSGDDATIRKGDGNFFRRITGGGSGVFDGTGHVGSHQHTIPWEWDVPWDWRIPIEGNSAPHTHGILNNSPQKAQLPHENMPPFYVLAYIIKL